MASTNAFQKTVIFECENLGASPTLLLTFDQLGDGMYQKYFPMVWKISTFGPTKPYQMTATYTNQLAFSKLQVDHNQVIDAATAVNMELGQQTTLTEPGGAYEFSDPVAGAADVLTAINKTGEKVDMAIGFVSPGSTFPVPGMIFRNVGNTSSAKGEFHPKLSLYLTSDYQETDVLTGAITTPAIWQQDLTRLDKTTKWQLTMDASGEFKVKQV